MSYYTGKYLTTYIDLPSHFNSEAAVYKTDKHTIYVFSGRKLVIESADRAVAFNYNMDRIYLNNLHGVHIDIFINKNIMSRSLYACNIEHTGFSTLKTLKNLLNPIDKGPINENIFAAIFDVIKSIALYAATLIKNDLPMYLGISGTAVNGANIFTRGYCIMISDSNILISLYGKNIFTFETQTRALEITCHRYMLQAEKNYFPNRKLIDVLLEYGFRGFLENPCQETLEAVIEPLEVYLESTYRAENGFNDI